MNKYQGLIQNKQCLNSSIHQETSSSIGCLKANNRSITT